MITIHVLKNWGVTIVASKSLLLIANLIFGKLMDTTGITGKSDVSTWLIGNLIKQVPGQHIVFSAYTT